MTVALQQFSPSGTVTTLSPTFTFQASANWVGQQYDFTAEIRRQSDDALIETVEVASTGPGPASSAVINFGLVNPLANGVAYKWRIVDFNVLVFNADSGGPTGYMNFTPLVNTIPTATLVSPVGGALPGTLTPALILNFTDPDSGSLGAFAAYQIQVRRVSDSVSFWDTGQVATSGGEAAARQVSRTYAGTTLVNGTAYQWRARVQDGAGAWSDYTAYQNFTPSAVPNPPTSLTPAGLQNTLTPTVSGAYNQGTGGTQAAFQYEIRQNLTTIYSSGDIATVIATGQAYGTNNPSDTPSSPPALAWGTTYQIRARSKDNAAAYSDWSAWQSFNTNAAPTTPTNLSPANGAVTGDTTPTLSWTHNDPDGDAQTAVEIELYDLTASAFVSGYNPKALTQATLTHDVTTALTQPRNFQWRVRTKGTTGPGFGPWSAWATFSDATGPTVTLTAPAASAVLAASAMTATWTFSGGSGTQQSYRLQVFASDMVTSVYDSGTVAGAVLTAGVPAGVLANNSTYYVQLTVTDTLGQSSSTEKRLVTTSFTPPASISGLSAVAIGGDE